MNNIKFEVETLIPTDYGNLKVRGYTDAKLKAEHVALVSPDTDFSKPVPVRVHSECLTGEAFASMKCECGPQLNAALDYISQHGGVVIYLRGHEGRGIGLINKLKAYALQEKGMDTVDANLALGLPEEAREYDAAVAILQDLGVKQVKLLTNNPAKVNYLQDNGIDVVERIPLVVGLNAINTVYLQSKADRMQHQLPL
jgi:3,4-dihydroxy 2-butanone 4-phosphate synthase / GTP cyclohydrolase II